MDSLSPDARILLRHFCAVLHLKTNAWCDVPKGAKKSARELEQCHYVVKYNSGIRLTDEGIRHLLTTEVKASDEPDPVEELMARGFSKEAAIDITESSGKEQWQSREI